MVHKKARSSKKKTTAKKVVKKAPTPARTVAPVAEPVTAVQPTEPADQHPQDHHRPEEARLCRQEARSCR